MKRYDLRWVSVWAVWIVFGVGFEFVSLFERTKNPSIPPLTQVLLLLPWPVTLSFFAWLALHLSIRYFGLPIKYLAIGRPLERTWGTNAYDVKPGKWKIRFV